MPADDLRFIGTDLSIKCLTSKLKGQSPKGPSPEFEQLNQKEPSLKRLSANNNK